MMYNTNELTNELSVNFIEYAAACNLDRAIPDAKSGLKPVARRILFGMYENGKTSNKPHVKCARIVGDVMGTLHPHGDSSIYGALVRLSQPWILRYPLIDFHGNQGSISGDGPAAYRYTEARLSKITEDGLLKNLKKKNVDFVLNYDETSEEPITLPSIFPNLLCNPNEGIGVAMACKWAPHNLKEVAQAIYDYMDNKEPYLPGPDFPTGGLIINKNDIPNIMRTGHGSVKIRGKYKIENQKIIFYEIPYNETIEDIVTKIGEVCEEKEIEGIIDAHDESNKTGIRIVIECDRGVNPESIIPKLFKKTPLQSSFSYNQIALVENSPTELNLKDCIKIYINHNIECLIRETKYDIREALKRKEIVDGLLKALANIDDIITMIKNSDSSTIAKEQLIKKYNFTENQAKAILSIKLSSLAKLEGIELNKEKAELESNLINWNNIITNKDKQLDIIRQRLKELVLKYGDERRTEISQVDISSEEKEEEQIIPEDVVVVMTKAGIVKRIPKNNFKPQNRAGKGIKTNSEVMFEPISTNTIDSLMIFTDKGKMYKILVNNLPEGTNASKGQSIYMLTKIDPSEKIAAITSLHKDTNAEFVLFFTKNGLIKKTRLDEYCQIKKSTGIQAIKIKENDAIAEVTFIKDEPIMIITKNGMCLRTKSTDISATGRVTIGVKGIKLNDGDEVIAGLPINNNKTHLLAVAKDGTGKRIPLEEYSEQMKGGKGVYVCSSKTILAGAALVNDNSEILLIGSPNSLVLKAKDITISSKASVGVILIKGSTVSSVIKL